MILDKLQSLNMYLNNLACSIMISNNLIHPSDVAKVNEAISLIAKDIEATDPTISNKLIQAKECLFLYNNVGTVINPNPVALGKSLLILI